MQDRDHLQAAVDALRTDASKGEIAGVEVVRTLARRAYHVDRLHSKSHQKSSKCQNFLRVWQAVVFWADQQKKNTLYHPSLGLLHSLPHV